MKKLIVLILSFIIATSLFTMVGCGDNSNSNENNNEITLENGLTIKDGVVVSYNGEGKEGVDLVIPETAGEMLVNEIGDKAFENATSLKTVTFPRTIVKVGKLAFRNCSNLEAVKINDLAAWCVLEFNANNTPFCNIKCKKMYVNDVLLTELTIPSSVTRVGAYTFYFCKSITKITVPSHVLTICPNAFGFLSQNLTEFKFEDPNNWYSVQTESEGKATGYHMYNLKFSKPGDHKGSIAMLTEGSNSYWKKINN